jgi:chromosome segregation ATPase
MRQELGIVTVEVRTICHDLSVDAPNEAHSGSLIDQLRRIRRSLSPSNSDSGEGLGRTKQLGQGSQTIQTGENTIEARIKKLEHEAGQKAKLTACLADATKDSNELRILVAQRDDSIAILEEERARANENIIRLRRDNDELTRQIQELLQNPQPGQRENEQLQTENQRLNRRAERVERTCNRLRDERNGWQVRCHELQQQAELDLQEHKRQLTQAGRDLERQIQHTRVYCDNYHAADEENRELQFELEHFLGREGGRRQKRKTKTIRLPFFCISF